MIFLIEISLICLMIGLTYPLYVFIESKLKSIPFKEYWEMIENE